MKANRVFLGLLLGAVSAWADEVLVGFEQVSYLAILGETVPVRIEIKSTLPVGLFSYGLRLVYAPEMGRVESVNGIYVPAELDFDGVMGPGARREVGDGFGAVKGTVDFFADPAKFYTGKLLAAFDLTCEHAGDYLLELELYRTIGPTETVFVAGDGISLDEMLEWGTATIVVIPEVKPALLLVLGLGCLWALRRRRL